MHSMHSWQWISYITAECQEYCNQTSLLMLSQNNIVPDKKITLGGGRALWDLNELLHILCCTVQPTLLPMSGAVGPVSS